MASHFKHLRVSRCVGEPGEFLAFISVVQEDKVGSTNEFAGKLAGFDALRELMGEDGIQELIGIFIEDGGVHLAKLGGALDRCDAAVLADEAHALKGSSATVGAKQMATLCGQLETSGRAGTTSGAADVLEALAKEFHLVTGFLAKTQHN